MGMNIKQTNGAGCPIYIMLKIGITGGIGSGKSMVCKIWQSLGAHIINADDLAKSLMITDNELKQKIIQTFGQNSYKTDGSLNRKYLADKAFEAGRVEELNRLVHPVVINEVERKMELAKQQDYEVVVYEAALLLQNQRPENLDYVALVVADENKRIARVAKRDNVETKLVVSRIKQQQNFDELKHFAEIIIENNGSLSDLKTKAQQCYQQFLDQKH